MSEHNSIDSPVTILGIETSCDETSAGVVHDGKVLSNIIASQQVHSDYGGVVPEMASREHERLLAHITSTALESAGVEFQEVDGIAVTSGPGLVGALLVGVSFAKGLAISNQKPLISVNHIEAHLLANFIDNPDLDYPFLCLLVSGGHTQIIAVRGYRQYEILGTTIDDAAGEAFDKVARLLDLGYPGGPVIDKLSREGDASAYEFPRGLQNSEDLNFSFSGLKTAVLYTIQKLSDNEKEESAADICASFQEAAIESLVLKIVNAVEATGIRRITIAGGVAANTRLRSLLSEESSRIQFRTFYPDFQYCTDNGAMIAYAGWQQFSDETDSSLDFVAEPRLSIS